MKFLLNICCILIICTQFVLGLWDFAVTTKSKIYFYDDKWQELTTAAHQFDDLSAIAFDETEEVIYFNDRQHNNGSIFSLKIPPLQGDPHIIEHIVHRTQEEWINGIAYDPLNRNLYWTDGHNKKIYFQSIEGFGTAQTPRVLVDLSGTEIMPIGIAVDICNRKLYWTNSDFKNSTIERIDLDGSKREVIVHLGVHLPQGIVIDQVTDRLYWVVNQQGVHYTVESANFDGTDRQTIVKDIDKVPFNLAVTKDDIFWTDTTHHAVWRHSKFVNESAPQEAPQNVAHFSEMPRGIVSRVRWLKTLENDQHCAQIVRKIRTRLFTPKATTSPVDERIKKLQRERCLNGGKYSEVSKTCICKMGYDGDRCEMDECHNYCVHGTCHLDSMGLPQCTCQQGFYGSRCQSYLCNNYCFNEGLCKIDEKTNEPSCECRDNFDGLRCEQNSTEICTLFCRILKYEPEAVVPFGCHNSCEELLEIETDETASHVNSLRGNPKIVEVCNDPLNNSTISIIVVVVGVVTSLGLVLCILASVRRFYKPARPRIRKTFVVKKAHTGADTPLTNRPLGAEQCEITIENCCNMNICETPCFDPKLLQQNLSRDSFTKEDKKILVNHMDGEIF